PRASCGRSAAHVDATVVTDPGEADRRVAVRRIRDAASAREGLVLLDVEATARGEEIGEPDAPRDAGAARDRPPGEELRAAARAIREEADAAPLEPCSLVLEEPGEAEVERGGVGVADQARGPERRLDQRRERALGLGLGAAPAEACELVRQ